MSKVENKSISDALEGVAVTITMLEAANGASTRFNKLIKQMKLTSKLLLDYQTLLSQPTPASQIVVTEKEAHPALENSLSIVRPSSGSVSPLKPSDVGLDTKQKTSGGRVSPAK